MARLPKWRFSIARLMGVVVVLAIGLAALRSSSEAWAGTMLLLTVGVLMIAAVGALCRGPDERAWWLGFLLFGVGYLALASWNSSDNNVLPTIELADLVAGVLGMKPPSEARWSFEGIWQGQPASHRILHGLWALALALLGSAVAGVLVGGAGQPRGPVEQEPVIRRPSRTRRRRPALIGLSGFWILAIAAALGRWPGVGIEWHEDNVTPGFRWT